MRVLLDMQIFILAGLEAIDQLSLLNTASLLPARKQPLAEGSGCAISYDAVFS